MLAAYVVRGLKAGLVAGLAFGLLVALVANPLVAFTDELGHEAGGEHAADGGHAGDGDHAAEAAHAEGQDGHHSAVSAAVTDLVSVGSGVLWGLLLGAVAFGVAFYFVEPALPGTGATKHYVLAAAGFLTASGAPWLVLPPQPPGVEQGLPTETRLLLYGGMMVAGAVVSLLAVTVYSRLRADRGRAVAAAAAMVPLGLLAVPAALAPTNAVTHSLPADLATGMTGLIVFGQAFLWVVLAATHARLHRRAESGSLADESPSTTDYAVTAD